MIITSPKPSLFKRYKISEWMELRRHKYKHRNQEPYFSNLSILIIAFGILKFLIHLFTIQQYGFHADELYYIEISKTSNWGFPDISPFVTWISRFSEFLFGNSLVSFRIFPCIFSALTVMLTGYITREIGGGKLAVGIACSAMICSPAFLATSYLLQPAVFDEFFWTLLAFGIIAYQNTGKSKFAYLIALALGFGMLNKYSILMMPVTLVLATCMFDVDRLEIKSKTVLGPFLLLLLILLPNILWQFDHGFPIFNYTSIVGKSAFKLDILDYLFQLFFFHGASVAVWTAGFFFLIYGSEHKKENKIWSIAFVVIILLLFPLQGKLYYGLGIFPVLFAFGGLCWAMMLNKINKLSTALFLFVLYFFALFSLPIVIPILSPAACRLYITAMIRLTGFTRPMRYEDGKQGQIPQFFAEMSGWKGLTAKIRTILLLTWLKVSTIYASSQIIMQLLRLYAISGVANYRK